MPENLVRVPGPAMAENGWTSRHSVIDIVNDDMPFWSTPRRGDQPSGPHPA
jgi:hypothetical protein